MALLGSRSGRRGDLQAPEIPRLLLTSQSHLDQRRHRSRPHTVRGKETKQSSDCHVSAAHNNNAWMAQLLLQGTNFMNFMGRYIYVATGKKGLEAIAVAEHDEPEAIYGSDLQRIAYPENFKKFVGRHRELTALAEHAGNILDIQAHGEYAYTANGADGLRVYDIANIDSKGFSERVVTSPVSPIGQRFYVATKNALAVASPSTLAIDPLRPRLPENEEQSIHLRYGFLYVADKEEGLVVIGNRDLHSKSPGVGTLLDGNPANNFLKRAVTFNPDGVLTGPAGLPWRGLSPMSSRTIPSSSWISKIRWLRALPPRSAPQFSLRQRESPCNSATRSLSIVKG